MGKVGLGQILRSVNSLVLVIGQLLAAEMGNLRLGGLSRAINVPIATVKLQ